MKSNTLLAGLSLALGMSLASSALAQNYSGLKPTLTLAPADAVSSGGGGAADDAKTQAAELAKKLQNPVAALISVPIQNNWDFGIGPANAMKYTANVQPVIPITLNEDWNLISRTILPVIYAESPTVGGSSKTGLGDVLQSLFFSPKAPTSGGWIWGAGPVALLPTGTDGLSAHEWAVGPTALLLKQDSGFTYGMLANHLWSVDGGQDAGVNATYMQPFASFTTKKFTTFGLATESTYDWSNQQWTVPLVGSVSQLVKLGGKPVQFSLGAKYYAEKPDGGPDWGLRFTVTFLFRK